MGAKSWALERDGEITKWVGGEQKQKSMKREQQLRKRLIKKKVQYNTTIIHYTKKHQPITSPMI